MNTKKKIVIQYKIETCIKIQYRIIDRTTGSIIGGSPTYEDAKVLVKILNKQHKVKKSIIALKEKIQ